MTGFRPCGACQELVPADTGCKHWKPRPVRAPVRKAAREPTKEDWARERARRAVEAFQRQQRLGST